jgi:hypothetical protein
MMLDDKSADLPGQAKNPQRSRLGRNVGRGGVALRSGRTQPDEAELSEQSKIADFSEVGF